MESFRIPEIGTKMKLFDAFEDLVSTTLSRVPSVLGRLRFIGGTRREEDYEHWGLAREHGKEAAEQALAKAHADIFEQSLTTPLPELVEEESREEARNLKEEIGEIGSREALVPQDQRGGTARHLNWVLRAVELIQRPRQK